MQQSGPTPFRCQAARIPQVEVVEATVAHLRGKLARQDELLESQRGAVRAAGARVAAQRDELADRDAALGDSQALVAAQGDLLQQQLMDMQASCWGEVEHALTSCLICQLCRRPHSSSCWTCRQAAGVCWIVHLSAAGQLPELSAAQGDLPQQQVRRMHPSAFEWEMGSVAAAGCCPGSQLQTRTNSSIKLLDLLAMH